MCSSDSSIVRERPGTAATASDAEVALGSHSVPMERAGQASCSGSGATERVSTRGQANADGASSSPAPVSDRFGEQWRRTMRKAGQAGRATRTGPLALAPSPAAARGAGGGVGEGHGRDPDVLGAGARGVLGALTLGVALHTGAVPAVLWWTAPGTGLLSAALLLVLRRRIADRTAHALAA